MRPRDSRWSRDGSPPRPSASAYLRERFLRPQPRLALGERLRGYASACIDVSDGLLADAGKLAAASGAGVELDWAALPAVGIAARRTRRRARA